MIDLNAQPEGLRIPDRYGLSVADEADLRDQAWGWILSGQIEPEEFASDYVDYWDRAADHEDRKGRTCPVSQEQVGDIFLELANARLAQQRSWGSADLPLEVAFRELAEIGVVARGHFTCCGTCGSAEIADERDDSRTWRGYVFFHSQDTETLLADRRTYLSYGVFMSAYLAEDAWQALTEAESEKFYWDKTIELMRNEVLPIFERHGINVEWDGSPSKRIQLTDVDYFVSLEP